MATVHGVNYTQTHAPSDGNWKLVPVSEVGGTVRMLYDSYTLVSGDVAATIINVGRLPKDSRVWDVQIYHNGVGLSSVIDVGFAFDDSALTDDPDMFLDGAALGATASQVSLKGGLAGPGGATVGVSAAPITIEGAGAVQITLMSGTLTADGTKTVQCKVLYSID